jgi:hypothetical protein
MPNRLYFVTQKDPILVYAKVLQVGMYAMGRRESSSASDFDSADFVDII